MQSQDDVLECGGRSELAQRYLEWAFGVPVDMA
jgi:hypothetical protein